MALDQNVSKSPEAAGKEFASRINDAVNRDDSKLYIETMQGITDWKSNNALARGKFEESLIGSVDLKTAALYETKESFSRIDTNKDARVKPDELTAYAKDPANNALQRAMIEKEILPNYESIANNSSDRVFSFMRDSHIRSKDLQAGLSKAAENRPSEKLTDAEVEARKNTPDFAARSAQYTLDKFKQIDTSENGKLDKPELESFAAAPGRTNLEKAYVENDLKSFDQLANASKDNVWSYFGKRDSEIRPGDLQVNLRAESAKSEVQDALSEARKPGLLPNDKIIGLATVRKEEGPFHSAERLLAAAGGEHDIHEVRALAKALKTAYKAEGHGDINDLKVKHSFVTKDNFDKLVKSIENEAVRNALKKLAAS